MWGLIHSSGVHATVAGVLLSFAVPVLRSEARGGPAAGPGLAEHFEHAWRPLSAVVAVPVFAFFAAGVTLGGWSGLGEALSSRVAVGVILALILGKTIGVLGATYLTARFTRAELDPDLAWVDVLGLAMLCGVGFTVSLLISELALGAETAQGQHATVAVVAGSLGAALLAAIVLRLRNRVYRQICEQESLDLDGDDIPDVFKRRRARRSRGAG